MEAYDYYENKWTYLPDLIDKRYRHASVSIGNKLFVIGGFETSSYEVFDSCSKKFMIIKSEIKVKDIEKHYTEAFCVGNSIIIFHHSLSLKTVIYVYDINNCKWSEIDCSYIKNSFVLSCMKYYVQ